MFARFFLLAWTLVLAACSSPAPPPRPVDVSAAAVRPVVSPSLSASSAANRPAGAWTDWPITPGEWVYRQDARGSIALFGDAGQDARVTLRCDAERRRVYLSLLDQNASAVGNITIRTSSALKQFLAERAGTNSFYIASEIAPNDNILDAAAYTRGRIALESDSGQKIAIPVWSELPRVIDDCRS